MTAAPPEALALPQTLDEITPTWLSWALSRTRPGVQVTDVRVTGTNIGTATKVHVEVDYAAPTLDLPTAFVVKGPFGKNVEAMEHTFTDEMRGYRDVVSGIGVITPRCYFAGKQDRNPVLILEDLRAAGCTFGAPRNPLTYEQAAGVLDSLAVLHARYWEHPGLGEDGEYSWMLRTVTGWHREYLREVMRPQNWAFYRGLPRGAAVPSGLSSDPARLEAALEVLWERHRRGPLTLGHGDAHIANVYFEERGGGLLDWEMRRCPWFHDVTYFLVSALDVADRRRWERPLLEHYLQRLRAGGIAPPTHDTAFEDYRREILYGYVLFLTNGDGTQYWTEQDNCAVSVRFAMAAEDHSTLAALETDAR